AGRAAADVRADRVPPEGRRSVRPPVSARLAAQRPSRRDDHARQDGIPGGPERLDHGRQQSTFHVPRPGPPEGDSPRRRRTALRDPDNRCTARTNVEGASEPLLDPYLRQVSEPGPRARGAIPTLT